MHQGQLQGAVMVSYQGEGGSVVDSTEGAEGLVVEAEQSVDYSADALEVGETDSLETDEAGGEVLGGSTADESGSSQRETMTTPNSNASHTPVAEEEFATLKLSELETALREGDVSQQESMRLATLADETLAPVRKLADGEQKGTHGRMVYSLGTD